MLEIEIGVEIGIPIAVPIPISVCVATHQVSLIVRRFSTAVLTQPTPIFPTTRSARTDLASSVGCGERAGSELTSRSRPFSREPHQ